MAVTALGQRKKRGIDPRQIEDDYITHALTHPADVSNDATVMPHEDETVMNPSQNEKSADATMENTVEKPEVEKKTDLPVTNQSLSRRVYLTPEVNDKLVSYVTSKMKETGRAVNVSRLFCDALNAYLQ